MVDSEWRHRHVTGNQPLLFCRCLSVYYCSRDHQKEHWKAHRLDCKPYRIETTEDRGRYLVANGDLPMGHLVISEEPILTGPSYTTSALCLGCFDSVDGSYRCKGCNWPLCNRKCETAGSHQLECAMLKTTDIDITDFVGPNTSYQFITPLRCLLLKSRDPARWKLISGMESHTEDQTREYRMEMGRNVVRVIRQTLGMDEFSEHEIMKVCGILTVNAFELFTTGPNKDRDSTPRAWAVYPTTYLMNHDCLANTLTSIDSKNKMHVRTRMPVKKGEALTAEYSECLWGTEIRRHQLHRYKYFWCSCQRCRDPTELGSFISSHRCTNCGGNVVATKPLDFNSTGFRCESCRVIIRGEVLKGTNHQVEEEVFELESKELETPIEEYEDLVERHESILHPNHYAMLRCKKFLAHAYGRQPGYSLAELSEDRLNKKMEMCRTLIDTLEIVSPRFNDDTAHFLYELHAALVEVARRRHDLGLISNQEMVVALTEAKHILHQALKHLYPWNDGDLRDLEAESKAKKSLEALDGWIELVENSKPNKQLENTKPTKPVENTKPTKPVENTKDSKPAEQDKPKQEKQQHTAKKSKGKRKRKGGKGK
ncbi:uncharacterized protein LOC144873958 isoform X1 [Branchiostoma floridae x Branchiostoma japonicum]